MCARWSRPVVPLAALLFALLVSSATATATATAVRRRELRKTQAARTPNATLVLLPNNTLGAKCLDGSPPGYYFRPGTGAGRLSWHIFLPGGAWCVTPADCAARAKTRLGSTKGFPSNPAHYGAQLRPAFDGILSPDASLNPSLYSWNLVRLIYCDGGGYAGTRGRFNLTSAAGPGNSSNATGSSQISKSTNSSVAPTAPIYLDGWNIMRAIMQDLQQNRGIRSASQILLSGSSAGGQATVNLCDWLAASFPAASTRCLVDSGFFFDTRDRAMNYTFRALAQNLTALHRPANPNCSYAARPSHQWKCFFPQYTLHNASTPVFLFHTPFDYVAAMIGNQLPNNYTYTNDCLREILDSQKNLSGVVRSKGWSSLQWKPSSACSLSERDTLFSTAFGLYDQVRVLSQERTSFGAYIPMSSVHSGITNAYWNKPWVNRASISNAFTVWSSVAFKNVSIILSQ
ncbi:hypothetical protein CLOM_g22394 [Closterium sp. NIES-68]|nr:hypothetical protein CLOM_g22394 [Closterium sp. NIES-68]GJP77834.1 hypothetical protein CLOP_g8171 [Closterium sp. NIES-67]